MNDLVLPTPIDELNISLGGGFKPGHLVVIGGRPGMGKSAFLNSLGLHAQKLCIPYEFYSSETVFDKHFENDFEKLKKQIRESSVNVKFFLLETLQMFVSYPDYFAENTNYEQTSKVIHQLKHLANELRVCIIITSQLSRDVDKRQGHVPMPRDLRDSGAIEEVSDVIILLTRRCWYDPMDKPGLISLYIAKNRWGRTERIDACFVEGLQEIKNIVPFRKEITWDNEEEFSAFQP